MYVFKIDLDDDGDGAHMTSCGLHFRIEANEHNTQLPRLGPDWTTKPSGSEWLFGSALHTNVDVGCSPIRLPTSTFVPFHRWTIFPTRRDQQHLQRSLETAGLHWILEPVSLAMGDDGRPDEMTTSSFIGGKALAWDATRTDSFFASILCTRTLNPVTAHSAAEDLKRRKYAQLVADFEFVQGPLKRPG